MDQVTTTRPTNSLAKAASTYLRSAQHQPVDWFTWGDEAFAQAQRENKPILLDIGAVWCHWCHVMDRESYEDPEIAALINELYVAVKVDRDERPDLDTRFQAAVAAISGQSGWPLTVFLTADGRPFFGETYIPPEDRYGRPGFPRVLRRMAAAFTADREGVEESAESVLEAVGQNETLASREAEPGPALLDELIDSMLAQADSRNGGFGSQPKFPHPSALLLLLDASTRGGERAKQAAEVARLTLARMAAGGLHDQLGGGFHRYAVDERWVVPHFEKLAYDNSELLRVYTQGFLTFMDPQLARIAATTLHWLEKGLGDCAQGGYYASQDADHSPGDDGDFYTWTRAEAQQVLTPDEYIAAETLFNLRAVGDMHHNPAKNVLHVVLGPEALAQRLGRSEFELTEALTSAKRKLLAARGQRPQPLVDRTLYTGWNGLCISAALQAGVALQQPEAVRFALLSLQRILAAAWNSSEGLTRVVAYGEGVVPSLSAAIPAVLDDYVFLAGACLDAWEVTGELHHFQTAEALAQRLLHHFYDASNGGFFDMDQTLPGRTGVLAAPRKPVQDAPTPAGNSAAASLLLRLEALTGEALYRRRAMETLEVFGGVVKHLGLYAASYALALRRAITPAVQVCVVGDDALAEELAAAATLRFQVNRSVVHLRHAQLGALPPALAQTLPHLPGLDGGSVAVVCRENTCQPPVRDPQKLLDLLQN